MTAGGAGKSQQSHKYILQYSKFASERSQVRTWGRQNCFLPRAPFNLVTPLYGMRAFLFCHNVCPSCSVAIPQFGHNFHFFQAIFTPLSKWRPWHVPCLSYPRDPTVRWLLLANTMHPHDKGHQKVEIHKFGQKIHKRSQNS